MERDARFALLKRIALECASALQNADDGNGNLDTPDAWSDLASELYRAQEIASQFCQELERRERVMEVSDRD